MNWLTYPGWQGIGAIASVIAAVAAIPIFLRNKQQKNHAMDVCTRFVFLFQAHRIERTKIPRFLGDDFGLTLADISTDEELLQVLRPNILEVVCQRLGVRRGWLEGGKGRIYEPLVCYKDSRIYEFLNKMKEKHPDE